MVRIAEIESGSIAEELSLEIGSRVVRINGERVRDGIDLTFMMSETNFELETISAEGAVTIYEIERDPGEQVGIVPAPDTIRECANKCVFKQPVFFTLKIFDQHCIHTLQTHVLAKVRF